MSGTTLSTTLGTTLGTTLAAQAASLRACTGLVDTVGIVWCATWMSRQEA